MTPTGMYQSSSSSSSSKEQERSGGCIPTHFADQQRVLVARIAASPSPSCDPNSFQNRVLLLLSVLSVLWLRRVLHIQPAHGQATMSSSAILGICAGITACIQLLGFAAAYQLQTEVFYVILGGINVLVLGAYSAYAGQDFDNDLLWANDGRKVANTIVFSCSRAWLLIFLAWRAHERGGDSRFDGVKNKFGLFLLYWTVQGVWVFTISMPAVFVNAVAGEPKEFSALDTISIAAWACGVVFEVLADVQKARWVKKGRQGTFCQVGVWKLSRHPNYFGEMLQWWSAWLFAYGSCSG